MTRDREIIIVANDVLPGQNMPVSGPGLRAFGLSQGLRSHGFNVTVVVPRPQQTRVWRRWRNFPVAPAPSDGVVLDPRNLDSFLRRHVPATVIYTNHLLIDHLRTIEGIRFIMDCFAPKMLEYACTELATEEADRYDSIRQRKLAALRLADAYIVNGNKKLPYFYGWILSVGKSLADNPVEVVNMCLPYARSSIERKIPDPTVQLVISGYMQPWSRFGRWFDAMPELIRSSPISLHLLMPKNRTRHNEKAHRDDERLTSLAINDNVHVHDLLTYTDYCDFLSGMHIALDPFDHTLEREYAMVTRTVAALCCGVPVIHPPFTEMSNFIAEYDAGWLVDPEDPSSLGDIVQTVVRDPSVLAAKSKNAERLAREVFSPERAVAPLVSLLGVLPP